MQSGGDSLDATWQRQTEMGLIDLVNALITHFLDHCAASPFNNSNSQAKEMQKLKNHFQQIDFVSVGQMTQR